MFTEVLAKIRKIGLASLSINNVGVENLLLNPISIYPVPASNWIFVDADNEFFINKTWIVLISNFIIYTLHSWATIII